MNAHDFAVEEIERLEDAKDDIAKKLTALYIVRDCYKQGRWVRSSKIKMEQGRIYAIRRTYQYKDAGKPLGPCIAQWTKDGWRFIIGSMPMQCTAPCYMEVWQ